MVKIEKILDGAVATIIRDDKAIQLFQGQLITYYDLPSLQVVGGKVIYSIDESEVIEVIGIPPVAGTPPAPEVEQIVEAVPVVETPAPAPAPVKTVAKKK